MEETTNKNTVIPSESIVKKFQKFGFNPTTEEIESIRNVFSETQLDETTQYEILTDIATTMLKGVLVGAMENSLNETNLDKFYNRQ